jgi:hypothetical protein
MPGLTRHPGRTDLDSRLRGNDLFHDALDNQRYLLAIIRKELFRARN